MNTIRMWEEINANVMPSFDYMLYDGWLLRFTPGYSNNNNSVWPLYAGELPLTDKIAFCEQQYAERETPCVFRLADLPGHDRIEALLIKRGYTVENPNLVIVRESIGVSNETDAQITELALDDWLDTAYRINPVDDPNIKPWQRQVLSRGIFPRRYAVVMQDGEACGYGYLTQHGKIVDLVHLWVAPELQGQGLGTQLIQGLLRLGAEDGATTACTTVNEPNVDAQRLCERLGFV